MFYLGCAVWAYKGWVGDFYPKSAKSGKYLELYSQRFQAVEGNTTFYLIPDRSMLLRWQQQTPSDFRFCLKLPREFSHAGLLSPHLPGATNFLELVKCLGDRLANVFVQLPPTYSPRNLADLQNFLGELVKVGIPLGLEVRHPGWFSGPFDLELENLLRSLNVARVILDSRPVYHPSFLEQNHNLNQNLACRKPDLPLSLSVTADAILVRVVSHPDPSLNQYFWRFWASQIQAWLSLGKTIYFFVHCPQEERSPHNARHFYSFLQAEISTLPPLPWDNLSQDSSPEQLQLF